MSEKMFCFECQNEMDKDSPIMFSCSQCGRVVRAGT